MIEANWGSIPVTWEVWFPGSFSGDQKLLVLCMGHHCLRLAGMKNVVWEQD